MIQEGVQVMHEGHSMGVDFKECKKQTNKQKPDDPDCCPKSEANNESGTKMLSCTMVESILSLDHDKTIKSKTFRGGLDHVRLKEGFRGWESIRV